MERQDSALAFMLRYENIAWFEDGVVKMLDRRVYPRVVRYEICRTYREVIRALQDMVTQSAGPYTAAAAGMALAAYECKDEPQARQRAFLIRAAGEISNARPTTAARMALITSRALEAALKALDGGQDTSEAVMRDLIEANDLRYYKVRKMAGHLAEKIPAGGTVMTQCFGETVVGQLCSVLKEQGKGNVRFFCPETRPYFQGARLTATVCSEMGFETFVITDNMPACVLRQENVDVFTSAADAICMDGSVINKVGTFQIAIAAKYLGVPYYATGAPDKMHASAKEVRIEQRDPDFVLQAMGQRTAADGVKGYYPAFDVTPPELVTGVVTDRGIYVPGDLGRYFENNPIGKYEMII